IIASGFLPLTNMMVFTGSWLCIDIRCIRIQASPLPDRIAVSGRKLPLIANDGPSRPLFASDSGEFRRISQAGEPKRMIMTMGGASPREFPADRAREPVPARAVREQLARVVNSPGFISSARLTRFLTHIVNRTIDGDLDSFKEFSIAMEVFDRTADYDPNVDAIVRVEARRLRSKLKAYYDEGPGRSEPVLIGLRPGSYVPIFRWLERGPQENRKEIATSIQTRRASIAVLPFVNMSPEPEQDYFCDGISEEIINALTRVSGLNVIARTSAFQFKGVALDIREGGPRLRCALFCL